MRTGLLCGNLPSLPSALLGTGWRSTGPGGPRLILPLQEATRSPSPPPLPAHLPPPPFHPSAGPPFSASWTVSGTPPRLHRHCAEVLWPLTCFSLWGRRSALLGHSHQSVRVRLSVRRFMRQHRFSVWRCDMSRPWCSLIG